MKMLYYGRGGQWLSVTGDQGSNPCGEEKHSSFDFESQSHDWGLLLN